MVSAEIPSEIRALFFCTVNKDAIDSVLTFTFFTTTSSKKLFFSTNVTFSVVISPAITSTSVTIFVLKPIVENSTSYLPTAKLEKSKFPFASVKVAFFIFLIIMFTSGIVFPEPSSITVPLMF